MYEAFWSLSGRPFGVGCETELYYPSETHQAALLKLRYAVENRIGAAMLVAESGLGKTLLVRALFEQLGESFQPLVHLRFPWLPAREMVAYLSESVAGDEPIEGPVPFYRQVAYLQEALAANAESGHHAVVVIDEAHVITSNQVMECLRLLLNFETAGRPDWTILLVGQTPLLTAVEERPALDDHLAVKTTLRRLASDETAAYVAHRLRAVGGDRSIFADASVEAIHHASFGIPRRINRLADLAMLVAFAEDEPVVRQEHVESAESELAVHQRELV